MKLRAELMRTVVIKCTLDFECDDIQQAKVFIADLEVFKNTPGYFSVEDKPHYYRNLDDVPLKFWRLAGHDDDFPYCFKLSDRASDTEIPAELWLDCE